MRIGNVNDLMVLLSFVSSDILFHISGSLCLIVLAAMLVLFVFTCGLFLLRVSCVCTCISLLLVIIPISGLWQYAFTGRKHKFGYFYLVYIC